MHRLTQGLDALQSHGSVTCYTPRGQTAATPVIANACNSSDDVDGPRYHDA